LIKNLVQQFENQAVKKGIYFRYILGAGVPEHIICDGVRLSQILLNLLSKVTCIYLLIAVILSC
jgi:signal transduction histidine kinase